MPISRFTNFTFAYLTTSINLKNWLQWMSTSLLNLLARVIYQKKALILADTKILAQLMARKLGSAPTTTKKATWSCFVLFCRWHTTTYDIFFSKIGRVLSCFALVLCFGRVLFYFGRVLFCFGRVLVVFLSIWAQILWFLANYFRFFQLNSQKMEESR